MNKVNLSPAELDYILSARAVRERAEKILVLTRAGEGHFEIDDTRLNWLVEFLLEVTRAKYPSLEIPYHSRWSHFRVAGVDRVAQLPEMDAKERTRCLIDLVVTSVLLDAGAGEWQYREGDSGRMFSHSEGLAVASFHAFQSGLFSRVAGCPLCADFEGLLKVTDESLKSAFQVSVGNPLVGLEGRLDLLHRLGQALKDEMEYFPGSPLRPGNLLDFFEKKFGLEVEAEDILKVLLRALHSIWPGRIRAGDMGLGDVWQHPKLGEGFGGLVPFHKLSQWLTYSLIEPLEAYGMIVKNLDGLTTLAEYRNGGLLIDSGWIKLKDENLSETPLRPSHEAVIEWRALTVALVDRLAVELRQEIHKSPEEFPLAKVLEGGTWWAGRKIAQQKRKTGGPPLKILSDGTVF